MFTPKGPHTAQADRRCDTEKENLLDELTKSASVATSCGSALDINGGSNVKYIVITGGTMSGLGKGTTISAIGAVLKAAGVRITAIKIDPYLNIDAGTMSPYEHGEVYVLEDGGEVDLDLGNYERFLDVTLSKQHNITTGKIYETVLQKERKGDYLGQTVQMVPHVTDCIQSWIRRVSQKPVDKRAEPPDVCLVEVGGTVGDIESSVYLEALQQFSYKVGRENFCLCHLSYVPFMGAVGEQKTKPTQHSVRELRQAGLLPDFIFCRCEQELTDASRKKISVFSQVPPQHVISVHDAKNLYQVPLLLENQNFSALVLKRLDLVKIPLSPDSEQRTTKPLHWARLAERAQDVQHEVKIGIVGKYTGLPDSYISVVKALEHAALEASLKLTIIWVESALLEPETAAADADAYNRAWDNVKIADGILCPGGFGERGIQGIVLASKFCRENKKPYFGICLGMQTAVIDFARHQLRWVDADSEEFNPQCVRPVIVFMPEVNPSRMGGTMRLGNRATIIRDNSSLVFKLYDQNPVIYERHRHRYEVNPDIVHTMKEAGFSFVGQDEKGQRMEIVEANDHPFFVGTQFHPEFTSRPIRPNPCFLGFVLAAAGKLTTRLEMNGGKLKAGSGFFDGF